MFKFFKKTYTENESELIRILSKSILFEKLTEDELYLIVPYMFEREYKQDEVVFFTGDPSQALYFVKSGMISLNVDLKDGFERLLTVRKDKAFGDNCLLENSTRIYTAIVTTELAILYVIPKINLMEVMENNQQIKAKIMSNLAQLYNQYTNELFKAYRSTYGFFELNTVYRGL